MKIDGFVISGPVKHTDRKWNYHYETFDKNPQGAWIRWLCVRPNEADWDRRQQYWINLGFQVKKATMVIDDE